LKLIISFSIVLLLNIILYAINPPLSNYLMPLALLSIPLILKERINLRFSLPDIGLGLITSIIILMPLSIIAISIGKDFHTPSINYLLFQLLWVSFPEEVFFRGFLQHSLGNTLRAVIVVSLLFSLAHLPRVIFYGDWIIFLSFFPSLIMGYLYKRTSNILPSVIFHFSANLSYGIIALKI
jgi:membrane protease YdiL (CAAX protease family)